VTQVWFNGVLVEESEVKLAPNDRGFTLADGVFETFRSHGTELLWADAHLERLRAGAQVLGIPVPCSDETIVGGLIALLCAAALPNGAVRLTLTRGPSTIRGLWPSSNPARPTLLASVAPLAPSSAVRLIVAQCTRRNERSPLSRIKSLNYGDNLLARREAAVRGVEDAVLLNGRDEVACCTAGNLFLRLGASWATPPITAGVLPGLARARVMAKLSACERSVQVADLKNADAAVVSNSLGCRMISELCGRPLTDGSLPVELASLYL